MNKIDQSQIEYPYWYRQVSVHLEINISSLVRNIWRFLAFLTIDILNFFLAYIKIVNQGNVSHFGLIIENIDNPC